MITNNAQAHGAQRPGTWSVNPATGQEIAFHPYSTGEEVERALAGAQSAFRAWRSMSHVQRAERLHRFGHVLEARVEALARRITLEMGKPVARARQEVLKCSRLCHWCADNAERLLADEAPDVAGDGRALVRYQPLGVVLGVMPWNFPLWQVMRAMVPVIAAGNGFILKHADNVQGSAEALADAFGVAGFPEGLFASLNLGRAAIPRLLADPVIVGVSVTAGVAAGAAVAGEAGRHLKRSVLELGGSDPFIVLADADLNRAVPAAIEARFQNSGQVCIAAKRIIVEEPVAEEFTRRFVSGTLALRMGDPMEPSTDIGPLARLRMREELHDQVERSRAMGAAILAGGVVPSGPGAFYPPTIMIGVTPDMPVFREETFGPVAVIMVANDAEHAVAIANDSEFGLCGALWSGDAERAAKIAARIETGGIFINAVAVSDPRVPIGGIKQSGYGRELSHFGLREFCNAQLLWQRD